MTLRSLIVALLMAMALPAWGQPQTQIPAGKVKFTDGETVQQKLDEGDFGIQTPWGGPIDAADQTVSNLGRLEGRADYGEFRSLRWYGDRGTAPIGFAISPGNRLGFSGLASDNILVLGLNMGASGAQRESAFEHSVELSLEGAYHDVGFLTPYVEAHLHFQAARHSFPLSSPTGFAEHATDAHVTVRDATTTNVVENGYLTDLAGSTATVTWDQPDTPSNLPSSGDTIVYGWVTSNITALSGTIPTGPADVYATADCTGAIVGAISVRSNAAGVLQYLPFSGPSSALAANHCVKRGSATARLDSVTTGASTTIASSLTDASGDGLRGFTSVFFTHLDTYQWVVRTADEQETNGKPNLQGGQGSATSYVNVLSNYGGNLADVAFAVGMPGEQKGIGSHGPVYLYEAGSWTDGARLKVGAVGGMRDRDLGDWDGSGAVVAGALLSGIADNELARWDSTTGRLQQTGVTIDDGGEVAGLGMAGICTGLVHAVWNPNETADISYVDLTDHSFASSILTEDNFIVPVDSVAHHLYADTDGTAPGFGNDLWRFTLYANDSATALTCDIDETATSCSESTGVAIAAGSDLAIQERSDVEGGSFADPTATAVAHIAFCLSPD